METIKLEICTAIDMANHINAGAGIWNRKSSRQGR